MNVAPHLFFRQSKRLWLWLFAALLPLAIYGVIKEKQSWRPRTWNVGTSLADTWEPIVWRDNQHLMILNRNGETIRVDCWDVTKEKLVSSIPVPDACDWPSMGQLNKGYFTCDKESGRSTLLWRGNNKNIQEITGFAPEIINQKEDYAICFTQYFGKMPLSSDGSLGIVLWNLNAQRVAKRFKLKPPAHYTLAPNSYFWPFVSQDNGIGVFTLRDKDNGKRNAMSHAIIVFDSLTGTHKGIYRVAPEPQVIDSVTCSPTGQTIAVTVDDGVTAKNQTAWKRLQIRTIFNQLLWERKNKSGFIYIFSPDGRWLAMDADQGVEIVDVHSGKTQRKITIKQHYGSGQMDFSPDGKTLAMLKANGTLTLWRVK